MASTNDRVLLKQVLSKVYLYYYFVSALAHRLVAESGVDRDAVVVTNAVSRRGPADTGAEYSTTSLSGHCRALRRERSGGRHVHRWMHICISR
jgi:hypothetical protein